MTKPLKSHIFISSNLLSTAVNGAHVKMADLRRWANLVMLVSMIKGIFSDSNNIFLWD